MIDSNMEARKALMTEAMPLALVNLLVKLCSAVADLSQFGIHIFI